MPDRQFFNLMRLEGEYNLFDYNVVFNDIIQLMERPEDQSTGEKEDKGSVENGDKSKQCKRSGDHVDVKVESLGVWYEGKIVDICMNFVCDSCIYNGVANNNAGTFVGDEPQLQGDILYFVSLDRNPKEVLETKWQMIRPRSRILCDVTQLKAGDVVLVNYNLEVPSGRGLWYDFRVDRVTKTGKSIFGDLLLAGSSSYAQDLKVRIVNEVMKIEEVIEVKERDLEYEEKMKDPSAAKQTVECTTCQDNDGKVCHECGCCVCGGKQEPAKQLICDECEYSYHLGCINPPLHSLPEEEEWFCADCRTDASEIVMPGGKLKKGKKKARPSSSKSGVKRDWGHGMACAGRTKECTIVPSNHFGPIPGVEVGTTWMFRVQVSESGVHRPPVAGIHGRAIEGAYSIVLSYGYEDDLDNGVEFLYTGSGGRDLSRNKRTSSQSQHQQLERSNKALARNCNAPVDEINGAKARNWRKGKPVRVVRSYKLRPHSEYAPEKGNRYDGVYKVVEYWKERRKSGFYVWRYRLRRDDKSPAPWTAAGKKLIEDLGLRVIYPDGYEAALEEGECSTSGVQNEMTSPHSSESKRLRVEPYQLPLQVRNWINKDVNEKLWEECLATLASGKARRIEEAKWVEKKTNEEVLSVVGQDRGLLEDIQRSWDTWIQSILIDNGMLKTDQGEMGMFDGGKGGRKCGIIVVLDVRLCVVGRGKEIANTIW
ncbi:E3 ubiquitin-protein ligase UHRF1-like [Hetaerina americana]|uniref:E3 ubiquitin-protein ligase UHRF1-like n=1 Tax=Hetaerina americana TaxID=62018 RepID=UPI003A7F3AE3